MCASCMGYYFMFGIHFENSNGYELASSVSVEGVRLG